MKEDLVGWQLGHYKLIRLLGGGGLAEVYLGEHIHLSFLAAIKVLRSHRGIERDEMERFTAQALILFRLTHPHIVRALDFGIDGAKNTSYGYSPIPNLVMDYASGGSLRERHRENGPLPLTTVVSYVKQVAEALQYMHDRNLVHRGVKPNNMLVGQAGEILLSDSGIAIEAQTLRSQEKENLAGTPAYMAPEQIFGRPRPASDQYALGIVAYEWLCGSRPFNATDYTGLIMQHLQVSPSPLYKKVPTISPAVEEVIMTALEKEPHKRFSSVRAFAAALEQAGQPEGINLPC